MPIERDFEEIQRAEILQAMTEIDRDGVPKGLDSQYYDVVHDGRRYPPKLVMAVAYRLHFGRKIETSEFGGGKDTKAFAILVREGFKIIGKDDPALEALLKKFVENALLINKNPNSASLKVGDYNGLQYKDLSIKASFGQGNFTDTPWIGFLGYNQTIQEGIYPVILFSRTKTSNNFEICYGISETRDARVPWSAAYLEGLGTSISARFPQCVVKKAFTITTVDDLSKQANEIIESLNQVIADFHEQFNSSVSHWAFQANPKFFEVVECLRNEDLRTWMVSSHKDAIQVGDKVILWVTGEAAGVYALLTIKSEVFSGKDGQVERKYWTDEEGNKESDRVQVSVDFNLADSPLTKEELEQFEWFKDRKFGKLGVMGTNFQASKLLYDRIRSLAQKRLAEGNGNFAEVCRQFEKPELDAFLGLLKTVVESNRLTRDDERVVFSCKRNSLQFTAGQRYCARLSKEGGKTTFGAISGKPGNEESYSFDGSPEAYWNPGLSQGQFLELQESVNEGVRAQLARSKVSSYRRHDNSEFRAAVFGVQRDQNKDVPMANETKLESLNTIFYGPPGTGKTKLATDLMKQFQAGYRSKDSAGVETFLQELTWWQVIALTMAEMGGKALTVPQISQHPFIKIRNADGANRFVTNTIWLQLGTHAVKAEVGGIANRREPFIFEKAGSSWNLTNDWRNELDELVIEFEAAKQRKSTPTKNTKFITFHQSYSYEDFIEGIRPVPEDDQLVYRVVPGSFRNFCERARQDKDNKYLFVIDEINRGNISKVFGELITLIEDSKREGRNYCVPAELQYSKEEFTVPSNVYIVGTMNTADRSIASLDLALRRRFAFKALYPDANLVKDVGPVRLNSIFKQVNARIRALIGDDYRIGHTFFLGLSGLADLKAVWFGRVLPLLQEYFYGDHERLRAVVPSFVMEEKIDIVLDEEKHKTILRLKEASDFGSDSEFISALNQLQ